MRDRFDIEQVLRITGLGIHADQSNGGADFDVACSIAVKKIWKAKEYEDLEEQGKLLKLPCYTVWFICDKKTATVMPKSIEYLAVYEIDGIDKKGYYWSTRSKALASLKELERGKGE